GGPVGRVLSRGEASEAAVGAPGVVFVAPGFADASGFGERAELGDVQQVVTGTGGVSLHPGGLPGVSGLAVDGSQARESAPVPQRPGDQLGPVVHPQILRCATLSDETFQNGDDGVGAGGTVDVHGEGLTGVLVDNVEELEPPLI